MPHERPTLCVLQNGPQMWMNEVACTPLPWFLCSGPCTDMGPAMPAPSEGPKGIWGRSLLGPFLITMGARELTGGQHRGEGSLAGTSPKSTLLPSDAAPCWSLGVNAPPRTMQVQMKTLISFCAEEGSPFHRTSPGDSGKLGGSGQELYKQTYFQILAFRSHKDYSQS